MAVFVLVLGFIRGWLGRLGCLVCGFKTFTNSGMNRAGNQQSPSLVWVRLTVSGLRNSAGGTEMALSRKGTAA